jgi:rubrerythrin
LASEDRKKLIPLLIEHEIAIRTLYRKYAKKFPELQKFWTQLSNEEQEHAQMLQSLKRKAPLKSEDKRMNINIQSVQTALMFCRNEITGANRVKDIEEALSIAKNIENTIIEKKFFEIFHKYPAEVEGVFKRIEESTRQHFVRIQSMFEKTRTNPSPHCPFSIYQC